MSFRWRLIMGVALAVLLTAAAYGILGYLVFKRALDTNLSSDLAEFGRAVTDSLVLTQEQPLLMPTPTAQAVFNATDASFRLSSGEKVWLSGGRPFDNGPAWRTETLTLDNGYKLELAVSLNENRYILGSYIRAGLFTLTLAVGFAVLLGLLLQYYLLHPLRDLRRGVEQLSAQAIPGPIEVPPGNDELSHLAQSFNRTTESLKAFLERERSFTRYASHELRTPLSNFRALTEGMRKGILSPEATWPQVEATLVKMESVLSGLLSLTRSPTVVREPLALVDIIYQTLRGLEPHERERIRLVTGASPFVLAQTDLLNRVVSNLLSNALKYSSRGVVIQVVETPGEVEMRIRDFGVGVPEEALGKLSEPFYRVNKQGGGLGLGLALVHHIVTTLGGRLSFENTRPGLEVRVLLPRFSLPKSTKTDFPTLEVLRTGAKVRARNVSS